MTFKNQKNFLNKRIVLEFYTDTQT